MVREVVLSPVDSGLLNRKATRLMKKERRAAPRVRVNLQSRWEGVLCKDNGTISDLSSNGCFVLTGGQVELKELIWLEISLPNDEPVHFWAEVVDMAEEIGFAVRFNAGDGDDQLRLAGFIETLFQSPQKSKPDSKSKFLD
jgi:hypothetical protein